MSDIHAMSVIHDGAKIGQNVKIGPFCVVGPDVELGDGVELVSNAVVDGITSIGENTKIFPFASIGHQPQDLKYAGEKSRLVIGKNNMIREHVTINPGTQGGGMLTTVGDNCLIMMGAHVAHDCNVGNNVILVNSATLAGHVCVEDFAIVGGLSAVHQFVRIGRHAMIGGMTGVENDVIPYGSVIGNRAHLSSLNIIGLKRGAFTRETIQNLRKAYQAIFSQEGTMADRIELVAKEFHDNKPAMEIVDFIRTDSSRAICQPKQDDAT